MEKWGFFAKKNEKSHSWSEKWSPGCFQCKSFYHQPLEGAGVQPKYWAKHWKMPRFFYRMFYPAKSLLRIAIWLTDAAAFDERVPRAAMTDCTNQFLPQLEQTFLQNESSSASGCLSLSLQALTIILRWRPFLDQTDFNWSHHIGPPWLLPWAHLTEATHL